MFILVRKFRYFMLLVGLGNPGRQYEQNRHNIGFLFLDALAEKYGAPAWQTKFKGEVSEIEHKGNRIRLLKPQTFMNLSGISTSEMANFYKIPLEDVVVIHDELDLPFCKFKMKQGGGSGGHNGLKSIDSHLGLNYHRLRFGIGHPGDKSKVHSHVLSDFNAEENAKLEKVFKILLDESPYLLTHDFQRYMSKIALGLQALEPKPEPKPKPVKLEEKPVEQETA
jgi:PTH1 family peptidyl-tRNA hydrolase